MKIYIVIYSDYDCRFNVKGVFTDKNKVHQCETYEQMLIDREIQKHGKYGRRIETIELDCCDDVNYDELIETLKEKIRKENQEKEDAIKEADLAEYNRIKEKYGL